MSAQMSHKVKLVTVNGGLRSGHGFIMVTTALSGRDVGLEPVEGGIWIVPYRSVALGVFRERTNRVYELQEFRLEGGVLQHHLLQSVRPKVQGMSVLHTLGTGQLTRKRMPWIFGYTCVILRHMKTAISLPDQLYEEAEKTAQSLGIPRSQLFAKALEEFIAFHKRENIAERLNRVYSKTDVSQFQDVANAGIESMRNLTKNDAW